MDKDTLIIIGNGMATTRLVEWLCERAATRFRILIIGDEAQGAYNRIMLTPVLSGEKHFADIVMHDTQWYQHHNVTFIAGTPVTEICREARTVTVRENRLSYESGDRHGIMAGDAPFAWY